jgi:dihydrofolate synthase/folylpolyglutamate synthase
VPARRLSYETFLEAKSQHYEKIDRDLIFTLWKTLAPYYRLPKIIHIVGTNGKGSTGRFLALLLKASGFTVGHYTSPHIVRFNERIWIDGRDSDNRTLQKAHEQLMAISTIDWKPLSYFEYTTLLGMKAMESCDFVVLEAGLGGEFDATNIFPKLLSLITNIGYDHQSFLGDTLDSIAGTKIRSIDQQAIIGCQSYAEIYPIAHRIATEKKAHLYRITDLLDVDALSRVTTLVQEHGLASYLSENLSLALCAHRVLDIGESPALKPILSAFNLPARFERIAPNIIIDAGHNLLAAQKITKELQGAKISLIYNSFHDKDYKSIIRHFRPYITEVLIIDIDHERMVDQKKLTAYIHSLSLPVSRLERVSEDKNYLIFGSFVVVEEFLKRFGYNISSI